MYNSIQKQDVKQSKHRIHKKCKKRMYKKSKTYKIIKKTQNRMHKKSKAGRK